MISLGLAVGTCGMAVRYGDQAARRFGGAFLASWLASLAVHTGNGQTVGWVMFCIDCATLGYFVWASLRSRLIWTAVATAFMALIVASRVATTIDLRVAMDTFRMSMALWSYGILTCIGFGAWSSRREPSRAFSIPS
jgi:hypothetical protein